MEEKKIYLTPDGLESLKKELQDLIDIKRPELLESLSQARNQGDLSENAEYQAAKEALGFTDGRIDELQEMLKHVVMIDESPKAGRKNVELGTTVTLQVDGKKQVYTVVGKWEANPQESKISHESPLGKALLGKAVGEKVEVEAPAGKILYTVVEIA